jgi:hypothetical protein
LENSPIEETPRWRQPPVKLLGLCDPFYECLGSVKHEHATTGIVRVEPVPETGLRTGPFVTKWWRIGPVRIIQKTCGVLEGLPADADERIPLRFGLNRGDRFPVRAKAFDRLPRPLW